MTLVVVAALVRVERVEGGALKSLYFLHAPVNTTVARGEEAVFDCLAAPMNLVTDYKWSKDGLALGDVEDLPRHSMRGGNLVIHPAQLEDEGEYQCQVEGRGMAPLLSRPAKLQVSVDPGRPFILEAREGDWVEVEQGEELLLTCESHGGRPYAELHWRDAEGQIVMGHAQEHVTRIGDSATFKTVSTLRFNPVSPMAVQCTAQSQAFPEAVSSRALTVQLSRKVQEQVVVMRSGQNITLSCEENSGAYKWLLNDREIEGETRKTLDLEDFTPDYDNSVVKCVQQKFGGESRLLALVRLVLDTTQATQPVVGPKQARGVTEERKSAKNVFICETESGEVGDPQYVWVGSMLDKRSMTGKDDKGNDYRCRMVPRGIKKVKQMEKKLKLYSKDLRRFSKYFSLYRSDKV